MPKSTIVRYSTELLFDQFLQDFIVTEDDEPFQPADEGVQSIQTRRDGGLILREYSERDIQVLDARPRTFRFDSTSFLLVTVVRVMK